MAARLELFWTEAGRANHERYLRLWAEYREKTKHVRHDDIEGRKMVHELYAATLKKTGYPRDERLSRLRPIREFIRA